MILRYVIRLFVAIIPPLLCTIPFLLFKTKAIHASYAINESTWNIILATLGIQFEVVNLPLLIGSLYLFTVYDKAVFWCQDILGLNDEFEWN